MLIAIPCRRCGTFTAMHPCLTCGACCAHYRVAFHWLETDEAVSTAVPLALTGPLDPHRLVMRGTHSAPVRCVALDAAIGHHARCTIYSRRPSVCRELTAAWENGAPSPQCDRARLAHGLAVLTPTDWMHAPATPSPASIPIKGGEIAVAATAQPTPRPSMPPSAAVRR